ncbi:hypothetical protein CIY_08210 [Butyrivibrio fibrisolvens 16/4]|nr:hypothetical protein CIY_08210 [Butyrivibrio fibrisolvens 16/4]
MADYLAENNYLFQGNFSSSYLYFSNFANKDNDFGNALKTSTDEQLNTTELADGITSFSYQGVMQQFETRIDVNGDEEVDWRNMTDEEWKKLLERIDADIDDMVERVKEETEEAKEEQVKEALEKEAVFSQPLFMLSYLFPSLNLSSASFVNSGIG